jgi:hypothetical protein
MEEIDVAGDLDILAHRIDDPPNAAIDTPDPVCTFDLVRAPRAADLDCVLTNSFGFGGANATLVLRKVDGAPAANGRHRSAARAPCSACSTGWGAVSPAGAFLFE